MVALIPLDADKIDGHPSSNQSMGNCGDGGDGIAILILIVLTTSNENDRYCG